MSRINADLKKSERKGNLIRSTVQRSVISVIPEKTGIYSLPIVLDYSFRGNDVAGECGFSIKLKS